MSDIIYAFQRNAFQPNAVQDVETLGQFVTFLARGGELRCTLVEMDYIYESTDSPSTPLTGTLYFSDREFFDDVTDHAYVDCVRAAPQYTRALSGDQLGTYISSIGTLELDNADGNLDFLLTIACDGSQIRFYYGSTQWPVTDFKHIFTAIVSRVTAPAFDRISVALKDTGLLLDKSVGGTTTVGGAGPNADRARPVNFGYIHNLAALVSDQALLIYVHSDSGTGTVAQEVRDRGVSVSFTDNADGTFTLNATPAGTITCDVLAEPLGSDNVRISHAMLFFIGTRAGLSALGFYGGPGRTYTTEDQDDYKVGISVGEARNEIQLLADIIESGNCFWAVKRTGEFTFGRLRLNDIASFGLAEINIYEDDIDQGSFKLDHAPTQYYKFQGYMSRNWSRQTDFASSLTPDEQASYSRPGLYVVQPDSVGTSYADAPELYHKTLAKSPVIDTLLSEVFSISDVDSIAQWMTTRRAIFLPWIEVITIVVGIEFYTLELGDPVRLFIAPRMGEDDTGTLFQVISNTIRLTDAKVELRIARRTVIQPVPPSWFQDVPIIDETQQEYVAAPPSLTQPVTGDGGYGPSFADEDDEFGWRRIAKSLIRVVESQKWESTTTGATASFTFTAAAAGDFLFITLCNVTHSSINAPVGWSSAGATFSDSTVDATQHFIYKVAVGGESTAAVTLFSGTGMKSAVFVNVRGSDGSLNSYTTSPDHTAGTGVTAPILSSVPSGALAFSVFAGGDDFPTETGAQFTCTVGGSGWVELQDACSSIGSSDQGGITVATNTGNGTLAAGTGTFSRSVHGHIGASFYLKS